MNPRLSRHNIALHCQTTLLMDTIRVKMTSLIGLTWTGFRAANTIAAGLSLVFFALASVFLYSRVHRERGHTTDSTVTQVRGSSKI